MLIDSHCHIHDQDTYEFAFSRAQKKTLSAEDYIPEKLLARAEENDVKKLICIGTSHEDSIKARDFAESHENVFWSYGIHPDEAEKYQIDLKGSPVAIGEVGLDYRNGTKNRENQFKLLEQMLQLAKDNNLPCIFHVRDAFDDFFAVLRNFPEIKRAVVHSFSDSPENLQKSLNEGFYIGVNGLATFADIPLPPLDRILLETDSPFLAPVPHRGEVDEPAFVKNIANFLAIHYQSTFEEVAKITTENAERLFKI